jgi:hypothetical protein
MKLTGILLGLMLFYEASLAQTIRLLLVSEIQDKKYGFIGLQNEDYALKMAKTISDRLDYKIQTTYLSKGTFSAKAIKETIDTLQTKPNDILMFVYTGKGYFVNASDSLFPFLMLPDFEKLPLTIEQIGYLLKAKNTQLTWVMADCRDTTLVYKPVLVSEPPPEAMIVPRSDLRRQILTRLLPSAKELVIVASSSKNEHACVSDKSKIGEITKAIYFQEKTSVFMKSVATNFEDILRYTDWKDVNGVSMSNYLKNVAIDVKNSVKAFNISQNVVWDIKTLGPTSPPKRPIAISNIENLNVLFTKLVATKNTNERKKHLDDIYEAFEKEATTAVRAQKQTARNLQTEPKPSSGDAIEKYLFETLKNYNSNIKKIEVVRYESTGPGIFPIRYVELLETWKK